MNFEEEYTDDLKRCISKYVTSKIRDVLGLSIKGTSKGSLSYSIETAFEI